MNEMNDKIIGNVEKELDEIEIIDTESIEEKLSFIVYLNEKLNSICGLSQ